MYLTVKDASNHETTMLYDDPIVVTQTVWVEWKIRLGVFSDSGVNPAKIKQLLIGVSNQDKPADAGTGSLYIDDICAVKSKP